MTIVAKVGNNETYTPVEFKSKGIFKKTMVSHQNFTDLNKTIDYCKRHNEIYEGLVDLYEFNLDGNIINLLSKCTYEEIFSWSQAGKDGSTHIFGEKDEGTWEWRKHLRTTSLSLAYYKNPEGSESEFSIGQSDPKIDAKIMYDGILFFLFSAYRNLQDNSYKKSLEAFDSVKDLLNNAKKTHDIPDWNDFNPLLEYFESKNN